MRKKRSVPRMVFFTAGVGRDDDELMSFELALRDAGIEKFNLVPVSSILPPRCRIVDRKEGLKMLRVGEIVYCVMARFSSREEGKEVFASVGAAVPDNNRINGYIAEHCGYWYDAASEHAEKLALRMFKTQHGDADATTQSITVRAEVKKCTTVIAAAVFVL